MAQGSSVGVDVAGSSEPRAAQAPRPRKPNYNQIHALPLPLTIYPLPAFVPHNPLSVLHVVWCSLVQLWSRPSSHPAKRCKANLTAESNSIHVTDPLAIRVFWERGFFGKGSLSRSEPSWLERERRRHGLSAAQTSEEVTRRRREERKEFKKERARKEREMIEIQLQNEGKVKKSDVLATDELVDPLPPQGLPQENGSTVDGNMGAPPASPSEMTVPIPNSAGISSYSKESAHVNITDISGADQKEPFIGPRKRGSNFKDSRTLSPSSRSPPQSKPEIIMSTPEHLQLTSEEAFFLVYGLGVREIWEDGGTTPLPNLILFQTFRQRSYFPPRPSNQLEMDDPFLLSYVVYHHFRSLGWVIRPGIKFGVDYLLYNRGPVFAHAEFAVVILPSYSDPYHIGSPDAAREATKRQRKPWDWLHCVNRVQSQVRKSLLLVYVEVPAPEHEDDGETAPKDIGRFLERYRVREINVKRWIPNRSRD